MRLLKRNLTTFEYIGSTGQETDIDPETGLHTGEPRMEYAEPVEYEGNISTPSLLVNQTFYGMDIRYTHVVVMDDPEADINEYGLIRWNDDLYDIRAVRRSLNVLSLAIRKQTKNNAEEESPEEPDESDGDGG